MGVEIDRQNHAINIRPDRVGKVRDWAEMSSFLDSRINPDNRKLLRGYYRAQLFIACDRKTKAGKLLKNLDKKGLEKFELDRDNDEILKAIDIAVRGSTNRDKAYHPQY